MEIGQNIYMYWTVAVTLLCTSLTLVSPGTRALVIPSGRGQEVKSTSITRIKEMGSARGDVRHNVYSRRRRSVTDDEMNTLLKEHNDKRRLEGAANMEFMTWSWELAEMAELWARRCWWGHGQPEYPRRPYDYLGQNLYATTRSLTMEAAMQAWYTEEKPFYHFNTGQCDYGQMCGHYTQIVWATSKEVGCAYAFCPNLINAFRNANYIVCNYGPAGNYVGRQPYIIGQPCTECSSGRFWCDKGLCRSDCRSESPSCECRAQCRNGGCITSQCTCECQPGYVGVNCKDNCEDTHAYCGASPGWPPSWCHDPRYEDVPKYCRHMCGLCKKKDEGEMVTCEDTTSPRMPAVSTRRMTSRTQVVRTTTTRGRCVTSVTCENGGVAQPQANGDGCRPTCLCTGDWQGTRCRESRYESTIGVIIVTSTMTNYWNTLMTDLTAALEGILSRYCMANPSSCCGGTGMDPDEVFPFSGGITVGQGFPRLGDYGGEELTEILLYAQPNRGNGRCGLPLEQTVLVDAVRSARARLESLTQSCCHAVLQDIRAAVLEPGPLPPNTTPSHPYTTQPPPTSRLLGNVAVPLWLIIILPIIVVIVTALIVALVCYCRRKKSRSEPETSTLDRGKTPKTATRLRERMSGSSVENVNDGNDLKKVHSNLMGGSVQSGINSFTNNAYAN